MLATPRTLPHPMPISPTAHKALSMSETYGQLADGGRPMGSLSLLLSFLKPSTGEGWPRFAVWPFQYNSWSSTDSDQLWIIS